jgi:hypothetical protein
MHREDESKYLLFIEPKKKEKLSKPVEDSLTHLIEKAIDEAEEGTSIYSDLNDDGTFVEGSGFRGFHTTECGKGSGNRDLLLRNGMITNSLAPFYLKWYRNSIPETEIIKLMNLKKWYETK